MLLGGQRSQMPFGKRKIFHLGNGAQNRQVTVLLDGHPQDVLMAAAGYLG